jgi:hypothetical protein
VLDKTVSLPPYVVDYLSKLGNGNLSLGVRIAAEYHRGASPVEQAAVLMETPIENPCRDEAQINGKEAVGMEAASMDANGMDAAIAAGLIEG